MAGADGGERAAGAGRAWVPGGRARNSSAFSRAWVYSHGPTGQRRGWGHVCSQETSWCSAGWRAGSVRGWTDLPPFPQPHVPGIHLSSPAETSGRRGGRQRVNGGTAGAAGRVQPGLNGCSQLRRDPRSSSKGWWDHGAPPLPDGQAAPGRALPVLASAGRGSAHGSKDVPLLPAHPGQVASGVRSCEPPFISFQAGARFPSPAALQAGGQESRGQGWCARRGRSAHMSSGRGGSARCPGSTIPPHALHAHRHTAPCPVPGPWLRVGLAG